MPSPDRDRTRAALDRVLVLTYRKSFWASPEAERFPHRVYGRIVAGHSTGLLNTTTRGLCRTSAAAARTASSAVFRRPVEWPATIRP